MWLGLASRVIAPWPLALIGVNGNATCADRTGFSAFPEVFPAQEIEVQFLVGAPMEYSPEQDRCMVKAKRFVDAGYQDQKPFHYIAGYAGVGKTTIAKEIASDYDALFAAYTGKAAYVLRSKGCRDARTIHSLIYKPAGETKSEEVRRVERALEQLRFDPPKDEAQKQRELERLTAEHRTVLMKEKKKPMFSLNIESELRDADVLLVDECSMVDDQMGQDLMSFKVPIIVLGDPMQLPPVGNGGFLTNRTPDTLLTEIHRQAAESGVLRMATDVRKNGFFDRTPGHYGPDCRITYKPGTGKHAVDDYQKTIVDADQLLVGRNATRHVCNSRIRELTGRGPGLLPLSGDKIVCLRNNSKQGLLNGSLWRVHESVTDDVNLTAQLSISSEEDGGLGLDVGAWCHHFLGKEDELKLKRWNRQDFNEFDFGYALTVHKAQGSQWEDVVMFDESASFRNDAQRWLYTGITRAAKQLLVVL